MDAWHLGVPVRDLARAVRFYVDVLGFELIGHYGADKAFVRPPGKSFTLEFIEFTDPEQLALKPHHLAFEAEDLASYRQRLLARGFDAPPIKPSGTGFRLIELRDPEGIRLQFTEGRADFDRTIAAAVNAA